MVTMEDLKNKLLQAVAESELKIDSVYYVTKDFFRDIEVAYQQFLLQSRMKKSEEENKKGE